MSYLWVGGADYGAYIMELSGGKRYKEYVWEEDTKIAS